MSAAPSASVSGVLVVPAPGDPFGLLADGSCGARVPMSVQYTPGNTWEPYEDRGRHLLVRAVVDGGCARLALVLWHDGALVPEGWDRFRRVAVAGATPEYRLVLATHGATFEVEPTDLQSLMFAIACALPIFTNGGTTLGFVLLDADGREIKPENEG